MSYGVAAALQAAVYQRLVGDARSGGGAGAGRDAEGAGAGNLRADRAGGGDGPVGATGQGAEHRFGVSVISDATGFLAAKEMAVAVSDALVDAQLVAVARAAGGAWVPAGGGAATGRGEGRGGST